MSRKKPAGMGHHRCLYIEVMLATEGVSEHQRYSTLHSSSFLTRLLCKTARLF